METKGSLENHISALDIGNSLCIQMTLNTAIELDVLNIIAKSGPGAHLSSKEIVSQIPTTNPISAAKNLERILNLLSVNSFLSISLRPATANDKTVQEKAYGLTKNALCLAPKYQGVKHVKGDMFKSIPKTQSIMLKEVLHNWDDEHCKKILRKCWEALPNTGKVIVVEYVIMPQELKNTPEIVHSLTVDIMMMTLYNGGKQRTTDDFDNLAKSVGFIETKIFPITHVTCVIEFLKRNMV
ncbi:hypothetical protein M0R45_026730 [Rubus argutus]|uniref:Uncharacterized protein n=1 Tax=Rubus argutus TaxID=59490 RepID=A0AAW1WZ06_RUBAR